MDNTIPFSSDDNHPQLCENGSLNQIKKKPLEEPMLSITQNNHNNNSSLTFEIPPTLVCKDIISTENSKLNSGIINNAFNNSNSGCSSDISNNNNNNNSNSNSNNNSNNNNENSELDKTIDERAQQSDSDDESTLREPNNNINTLAPTLPSKSPILLKKKSSKLQEPDLSDDEDEYNNPRVVVPETPEKTQDSVMDKSIIKRNVSDLEDLLQENNKNVNKKNDKLFVPDTPEKDQELNQQVHSDGNDNGNDNMKQEYQDGNADSETDGFIITKRSKSQSSNYYSYEELNKNKRKTVTSDKPNQDETNPNDELSGEFINSKKLKIDNQQQQQQQQQSTPKKLKKSIESNINAPPIKGLDLEDNFSLDQQSNSSSNNNNSSKKSNKNNTDNNNIEILPPKATNRKILLDNSESNKSTKHSKSTKSIKKNSTKPVVDQAYEDVEEAEEFVDQDNQDDNPQIQDSNEDTDNEEQVKSLRKKPATNSTKSTSKSELYKKKSKTTSTPSKLCKKKSKKDKQEIIEYEEDDENEEGVQDEDEEQEMEYNNSSGEIDQDEEQVDNSSAEEEDEDTDLENNSKVRKSTKSSSKKKAKVQKSTLFKGYNFLLTGIGEGSLGKIEQIIINGGGKIFENPNLFFDLKKKMLNEVPNKIILSPECVTTVKYLRGIVEKVDCLDINWVIESSQDDELKPYEDYILPIGKSILNDKFIYPNDKFDPSEIFDDFRFELSTSNRKSTFKEDWSLILKKCGAKIVQRMLNVGRIDAYLLDGHVGTFLLCQVSQNTGVPIVSTKWVFQSIIHQKKLNFNLHPSFLILDNSSQ